jgi:hypothetical protein
MHYHFIFDNFTIAMCAAASITIVAVCLSAFRHNDTEEYDPPEDDES